MFATDSITHLDPHEPIRYCVHPDHQQNTGYPNGAHTMAVCYPNNIGIDSDFSHRSRIREKKYQIVKNSSAAPFMPELKLQNIPNQETTMAIRQGQTKKETTPEETSQVARTMTRYYRPTFTSEESLQYMVEESHSPSECPSFVTNMDAYRETIKRGKEIMRNVRFSPHTLRGGKCLSKFETSNKPRLIFENRIKC